MDALRIARQTQRRREVLLVLCPEGVASETRCETKKPANSRDEERELKGAIPSLGVDYEDRMLDVFGLARDLLLELRIAHYLRVGLHFRGDLLLLSGRNHAARVGQIGEAHR